MTYETESRNYPVPNDGQDPWDDDYQTAMEMLDYDIAELFQRKFGTSGETYDEHIGTFQSHNHSGTDTPAVLNPSVVTATIVGTSTTIPSDVSVTLPEGYSEVVLGPFELNGELTLDGRMKIE